MEGNEENEEKGDDNIKKSYRDSALQTDTLAYTSVMLKDAKQGLDETTRENFELQERLKDLEKQFAQTLRKFDAITQLSEDQHKRIIDLQNKEDALAVANRNLLQQVEFLRLQATSTPFPFPNSLPNNFNFSPNDPLQKGKDKENNNNNKRNTIASWGSAIPIKLTPDKRFSSPTVAKSSPIATPKSNTSPSSAISPTSPTSAVPASPYKFPATPNSNQANPSNLNANDSSPTEQLILDEFQMLSNDTAQLQPVLEDEPNEANASALTAHAIMAQATHERVQSIRASTSSIFENSSTSMSEFPANATAMNSNGPSAITNGASASSSGFDIGQRLTSSAHSLSGGDLSRFNSLLNINARKMGLVTFTTKMILSGMPIDAHQEINCAAFHISGEMLTTGGGDHLVKVWDTSNHGGVPVYKKSMQEATSSVLTVQFSPNGNLLCGTSNDKNSYMWDPIGRELHTLSGHTEKVTSAAFLVEQQLVTCSWDRHIKLFDLNRGFCTKSFHLGSRMNSMCIGPFNYTVATGHVDKTIRVFDYRNGNTEHTLEVHSAPVTCVLSCPENPTNVLTSAKDNTLKLIDLRTLEVVHNYKHSEYKNQRDINLICFSPNGKFIVAGGEEGKIVFWNTQTMKVENIITCSPKSSKCVTCVTWNPKRNQLIACHDNSLYLYDGEVVPVA